MLPMPAYRGAVDLRWRDETWRFKIIDGWTVIGTDAHGRQDDKLHMQNAIALGVLTPLHRVKEADEKHGLAGWRPEIYRYDDDGCIVLQPNA